MCTVIVTDVRASVDSVNKVVSATAAVPAPVPHATNLGSGIEPAGGSIIRAVIIVAPTLVTTSAMVKPPYELSKSTLRVKVIESLRVKLIAANVLLTNISPPDDAVNNPTSVIAFVPPEVIVPT